MANSFFKNYFGFNKQQRNGLLVLISICLCLFFLRFILPYFFKAEAIELKNLALIEQRLDSLSVSPATLKPSRLGAKLFSFDPNTVSYEELLALDLSPKIANTLINYRSKGYKFKSRQDLLKVYGLSQDQFKRIAPYVVISKQNAESAGNLNLTLETEAERVIQKKEFRLIELNSADSLLLLNINGIGPSFAKRILKYRNLLGGYYQLEQLKEVYGLNDEVYQKIKSQLKLDPALITKINLNSATFKTLSRHPYIGYELSKKIGYARDKSKLSSDGLKALFDNDSAYSKLAPYCVYE